MNEIQIERDLRKDVITQKVTAYQKAMWTVKDLAIIMDVTPATARKYFNKVKSEVINQGNSIEIHGRLPKERLLKALGISIEKEIKYYNLING